MKRTPWLLAALLILAPLGAEELLPPIPEGLDGPPPIDANEPLPSLQDFDKFLPEADPTRTDLQQDPAKPEAALQAIEKALPAETPIPPLPSPKAAEPVLKPTATWAPQTIAPVPTAKPTAAPSLASPEKPASAKPSEPSVPKASEKAKDPVGAPAQGSPRTAPSGAAPSTVSTDKPAEKPPAAVPAAGLTGYFPVAVGKKWTYEYLKAAAGKKVRTVECTKAETFPNGTVRATLVMTEEAAVTETYSLLNGMVLRTGRDGQPLEGDHVFKLPKKGAPSAWTQGTKTFSASFGKAQVYQKTYPDCVVVKEKDGAETIFTFYAKGIGLVALEVYGAGMKLDHFKSFALVPNPAK